MTEAYGQLAFDAFAAEDAKQTGMELADQAPRVRNWKAAAAKWLSEQQAGRIFTADDLVAEIGLPDEGKDRNNAVGAWVAGMSASGRIVFTGKFRPSERVIRHRNSQRVWKVR